MTTVYVVIRDPDFNEHYDSVWSTIEAARNYVFACERKYRVEDSRHQYDHDIFKTGRWTTNKDGVEVWGYPGSGNTYGVVTEELSPSDDGSGSPRPQCPEGLLIDGTDLHRCVRDGGHDGSHWSRGHEREWMGPEIVLT